MAFSRDSLTAYLNEKLGLDLEGIEDDTPLFSSNLLDSFSMVDVIMFIEKSADLKMNPTEVNLDNLDTIGRIVAYVEARQDGVAS